MAMIQISHLCFLLSVENKTTGGLRERVLSPFQLFKESPRKRVQEEAQQKVSQIVSEGVYLCGVVVNLFLLLLAVWLSLYYSRHLLSKKRVCERETSWRYNHFSVALQDFV